MATSSVASVVVATLLSSANTLDNTTARNMTARNVNTLNTFINGPLATLKILTIDIQQTQGVTSPCLNFSAVRKRFERDDAIKLRLFSFIFVFNALFCPSQCRTRVWLIVTW